MKKTLVLLAVVALAFASCKKDGGLNLSEKIIGKWIQTEINGQPALTNKKSVTTFYSDTVATVSTSRETPVTAVWSSSREFEVEIDGNKITLTSKQSPNVTLINEYVVSSITDTEMVCRFKHITIRDGQENGPAEQNLRLTKLSVDYAQNIIGKWECTELTGIETYNDVNARLEFFNDGTYKYWRKINGEWEVVTNREFQDYFVDGTLLATRWKNVGEEELREWWEIASLAEGKMEWTALRQTDGGTTVQQGMKWVKVN